MQDGEKWLFTPSPIASYLEVSHVQGLICLSSAFAINLHFPQSCNYFPHKFSALGAHKMLKWALAGDLSGEVRCHYFN